MDPAVKAAWIEALRSGRYKQTEAQLRTSEGFCCLGVLCDLGERKAWEGSFYYGPDGGYSETHLPESVRELAGLSAEDQEKLINMNDEGKSFKAIATYLERRKTI